MVPFILYSEPDAIAVCDDDGRKLSYASLASQTLELARALPKKKCLIFLYARNDVTTVVRFLAALAAGHAVTLLDPGLPSLSKIELRRCYKPAVIMDGDATEFAKQFCRDLHPSLAVLLSTSGSTGGAKFVRLSLANLQSNALSIASSLRISSEDVAVGHLALHYSYGLSVLLSHFCVGAKVLLTSAGLLDRNFWSKISEHRVTHFPGVPFHYELMLRMGLQRKELSSLRTLTQAGGHLAVDLREKAYSFMEKCGGRFYVMYGQTEASPRISTLDHDEFLRFRGTVGKAVPGGRLVVKDDLGALLNLREEGEVWYEGPNVMLGYAESAADLGRGDDLGGVLATGDVGWLDADGRLTLTGRVKRIGKVYGLRVNLDELEQFVRTIHAGSAVVQRNQKVTVFLAGAGGSNLSSTIRAEFAKRFTIPYSAYEIAIVDSIPITARGKVDYQKLEIAE